MGQRRPSCRAATWFASAANALLPVAQRSRCPYKWRAHNGWRRNPKITTPSGGGGRGARGSGSRSGRATATTTATATTAAVASIGGANAPKDNEPLSTASCCCSCGRFHLAPPARTKMAPFLLPPPPTRSDQKPTNTTAGAVFVVIYICCHIVAISSISSLSRVA